MARNFVAFTEGCSRVAGIAATLLLIAAMLVITEMIFVRYVFRAATVWQTDFVLFSATAAIFIGAPYVLLLKGHVGVDVIETTLAPATRRRLQMLAACLSVIFCAAMMVTSAAFVHEAYEGGWRHASLWAPRLWIPMLSLPVGFGLLCLQYFSDLIKLSSPASFATAPATKEYAAKELDAKEHDV